LSGNQQRGIKTFYCDPHKQTNLSKCPRNPLRHLLMIFAASVYTRNFPISHTPNPQKPPSHQLRIDAGFGESRFAKNENTLKSISGFGRRPIDDGATRTIGIPPKSQIKCPGEPNILPNLRGMVAPGLQRGSLRIAAISTVIFTSMNSFS
jgi:hypothetical protein